MSIFLVSEDLVSSCPLGANRYADLLSLTWVGVSDAEVSFSSKIP